MSTRLGIFCNRLIEAGWLAALIVIPVYFNPTSFRIFEADKAALLRSLAVIVGLAWAIKGCDAWLGRRKPRASAEGASESLQPASLRARIGHPIILAAVLFLVIHAVASVFSILPEISFWGQYDRLQGLYTLAAYLVFFFSVVALLRTRAQLQRLITAVLLVSVPVALYGILQHFGVQLWQWTFDVEARVLSTMGNPNYLAAILSLAVPLTLYRLFETKRDHGSWLRLGTYLVILVLQLVCILFTQSRGPLLGLAFAALFGSLLWTLTRHQWGRAKLLLGFSGAAALLLVVINLPNTPLTFVQEIPYLNRLALLANTEGSSQGRVLIWEGAVDLASKNPRRLVVGYGPEATRYAFYPHHSAAIGNLEGWNVVPDRMHNEGLDSVITTGVVGFFIFLFLFTSIVYYGLRWAGVLASSRARNAFLALWFSGALVAILALRLMSQSWTFSGVAVLLGLLGGALLYLAGYAFLAPRREPETPPAPHPFLLLIILFVSSIIAHFVDINVGIGVTATRLYFWIYTGVLVALGLYYKSQADGMPETPAVPEETPSPASKKREAPAKKRSKRHRRKPETSGPMPFPDGLFTLSLLAGLVLGTVAFSFFGPTVGDEDLDTVRGFIVACWVLAVVFLAVEWYAWHQKGLSPRSLALFAGVAWLPALLFIALKNVGTGGGLYHIVLYNLIVLLAVLVLGLLLHSEEAPRVRKSAPLSFVLGGVLAVVALLFIYQTNIQIVRADVLYKAAKSSLQQQRFDDAITRYRAALALASGEGRYQLELAQALASKAVYASSGASESDRLFREAEEVLSEAVSTNPYEPYNQAQLAEIYRIWGQVSPDESRRTERTQKAVAYLEAALQYNKQNILFLRKWAQLQEEEGHQGMENYRELLRWDSTNTALYMQLGNQYRTENQWEEAATMYEGALRHSTQPMPNAHRLLAVVYQRLGRLEEALQHSEQALALNPDVETHHTLVITLYQRTGQCGEALAHARTALQRWPNNDNFQTQATQLGQQCGS